jgi:hypothetical protein
MEDFGKFLAQFKDPYERKARLLPGLLVLGPFVLALGCQFGLKHPVLAAAGTVLGACGSMYALASVVRGRGKALEEKLVREWGGMPTTIALRHSDNFLDSISKQRYHDLIRTKLGIPMPSADEERIDPAKADDTYVGATKRLRELTRSDRALLFKENISYGFHRNMLAMKLVGIVVCIVSVLYGLVQAKALLPQPPYFAPTALLDPGICAGITLAVSMCFLAMWLLYFNRDAVRRIGFVYAERLFERLPSLRGQPAQRRSEAPGGQ